MNSVYNKNSLIVQEMLKKGLQISTDELYDGPGPSYESGYIVNGQEVPTTRVSLDNFRHDYARKMIEANSNMNNGGLSTMLAEAERDNLIRDAMREDNGDIYDTPEYENYLVNQEQIPLHQQRYAYENLPNRIPQQQLFGQNYYAPNTTFATQGYNTGYGYQQPNMYGLNQPLYNPYLDNRARQAEEAMQRRIRQDNIDAWKRLSGSVRISRGENIDDINNHIKQYDTVFDEPVIPKEIQEVINFNNKLARMVDHNVPATYVNNMINNKMEKAKETFPDNMDIIELFDKLSGDICRKAIIGDTKPDYKMKRHWKSNDYLDGVDTIYNNRYFEYENNTISATDALSGYFKFNTPPKTTNTGNMGYKSKANLQQEESNEDWRDISLEERIMKYNIFKNRPKKKKPLTLEERIMSIKDMKNIVKEEEIESVKSEEETTLERNIYKEILENKFDLRDKHTLTMKMLEARNRSINEKSDKTGMSVDESGSLCITVPEHLRRDYEKSYDEKFADFQNRSQYNKNTGSR